MCSVESRKTPSAALQRQNVVTNKQLKLTKSYISNLLVVVEKHNIHLINCLITQKRLFLFVFVGQKAVQSCDPMTSPLLSYRDLFVIYYDVLQAVPTSNGTSFDFVTAENGPVCLDLYSTPHYKMDQPSDGTGELFTLCCIL